MRSRAESGTGDENAGIEERVEGAEHDGAASQGDTPAAGDGVVGWVREAEHNAASRRRARGAEGGRLKIRGRRRDARRGGFGPRRQGPEFRLIGRPGSRFQLRLNRSTESLESLEGLSEEHREPSRTNRPVASSHRRPPPDWPFTLTALLALTNASPAPPLLPELRGEREFIANRRYPPTAEPPHVARAPTVRRTRARERVAHWSRGARRLVASGRSRRHPGAPWVIWLGYRCGR
mmetsp:Transcript_7164/g.21850  ORF Transcript_7164/g.21850 Transcript_7164/m.21850 type:complete len:235 (+) Transcript_7164:91-795(+)